MNPNTNAGYDNTAYNSPGGAPQQYGGNNTGVAGGAYPDTGKHGVNQGPADKLANMIPGHNTGAPGSMPGSNNPSAHHHDASHTGATGHTGAYDNSSYGSGNTAATGTGPTGLAGHHNSGATYGGNTAGTHSSAYDQPAREGPTDKLANMIPGHHSGASGNLPGSNNPSTHSHGHSTTTGGSTTGAYGSSTGTHGTTADGYGTTGGTYGAGHDNVGNTGVGSNAYGSNAATHGSGVTGGTTTGAAVGQDHKPSMGEKLGGKVESMLGKITKDPHKVQEGEMKAAGQLPPGSSTTGTTGTAHHH